MPLSKKYTSRTPCLEWSHAGILSLLVAICSVAAWYQMNNVWPWPVYIVHPENGTVCVVTTTKTTIETICHPAMDCVRTQNDTSTTSMFTSYEAYYTLICWVKAARGVPYVEDVPSHAPVKTE